MIYFVDNNTESLAAYIARVMHTKKLTTLDVQNRSGNQINQSYVVKLKNGDLTNPSISKIKALAKGLGVPEFELIAIMQGNSLDKRVLLDKKIENLGLKFSGLSPDKKEQLQALIDLMDREIDRAASEN